MKSNHLLFVRLIAYLLLFIPVATFSQSDDYSDYQKIRDEGFNNSRIQELAIHLTDIIGPRLSGSEGFNNSIRWAEEKLNEMGLNAKAEPWGEFGHGWQMEKFYIAMSKPYYQPLVAVPQAWSGNTDGFTNSEVVLINAKTKDDLEEFTGKLAGKIVVTPYEEELEVSFSPLATRFTKEDLERFVNATEYKADLDPFLQERKYSYSSDIDYLSYSDFKDFCEEEGAVALIEKSGSYGTVRSVGERHGRHLDELGLPIIDMTHEHYARMVRLIDRDIDVQLELDVRNTLVKEDKLGYNVIAEIKGADRKLKEEVVMIGAHIDSWHAGTGGNDNGSGVVVMMEVMRILKESGVNLDRTVRLALWGNEEQGLLGSRSWAKENVYNWDTNEKGHEFDKISAYYNFDYGTGRIRGIFLHDNFALKPIFDKFFQPIEDLGVSITSMRNPGSSDHVVFNRLGIPGFAFIQDRIDYGRGYHTNMDTYERIRQGDLKQAAIVVASLVYQTANYPDKLPRRDVFLEE
ncbi:MAG: M20/M25/M40 family metallo-hydrolase [Bacteroidales bacterium]